MPDSRQAGTRDTTTRAPKSSGKPAPLTERGRRTRAKILDAARRVFERDGYLDVRVTDITTEAGVAAGSFYTYFEGKEETFRALLDLMRDEILHPGTEDGSSEGDPVSAIRRATNTYFESYRSNVGLWRIFEQMAAMDASFRQARVDRAKIFVERNASFIRHLQEEGIAKTTLSPETAAIALSSMVSRTAQVVLNFGYTVEEMDELVETIVAIWVRTLEISQE